MGSGCVTNSQCQKKYEDIDDHIFEDRLHQRDRNLSLLDKIIFGIFNFKAEKQD